MDLERLRRRVADGDLDAARSLLTEAERRGDPMLAIEAHAALGERSRLLERLERAWVDGDSDLVEAIGRALGLVLDPETCAEIDALYKRVRGRARLRIFALAQVLALLERARREPDGWFIDAAAAESSTRFQQRAMTALAVRDDEDGSITLGLSWCHHYRRSSGGGDPRDFRLENVFWRDELDTWPRIDRDTLLEVWGDGGDGRVLVSICEASVSERASNTHWHEALELLLAREPSVEVWHALVDLLAAWPGGVDPELGESICARLDARWPDARRQREVADRRRWWPKTPAVPTRWPIARTLCVSSDQVDAITALEGLECTRRVDLTLRRLHPMTPSEVRPVLRLLCDDRRLQGVRALKLHLRDGGMPHLIERADWLASLRSLEVGVLGTGPRPEEVEPVAALLARTPALRALDVRADLGGELAAVGALAHLHELETLTMYGFNPDVEGLSSILEPCGRGDGLRALHLRQYDAGVLAQVAGSAHTPGLRRLALRDMRGRAAQAAFDAVCEQLDPIEHLHLGWEDPEQRLVVGALASAPWLARLDTLELVGVPLDTGAVRALTGAAPEARPTRLALRGCGLDNDALAVLRESGWLEGVEVLDLADNALSGTGIEAMVTSARAPRGLRELDLSGNKLGVTGARALAAWPGARGVARMWLGSVGARGVELLNTALQVRGELGGGSKGYRPPPWRALVEASGGAG